MLLFSPGSFRVRKFIVKVYRDWKQMKFSSCWSLCVCMCTGVICTHCMHTHCSLPPSGLREKNKKKGKVWELIGWGKYSLIRRKEGGKKKKQVMHNTVSHHLLTDAQPVLEPWQPPPANFPQFYCSAWAVWYGTSLWSAWARCPGCVPSQLLVQPLHAHWQGSMRNRKALGPVSTAQQQLTIGVLSALFSSKIRTTAPCQLLWWNLTLSQPKLGHVYMHIPISVSVLQSGIDFRI